MASNRCRHSKLDPMGKIVTEADDYVHKSPKKDLYVQICPHERLYYPRLQEIANLPRFRKMTKHGIPALKDGSHGSHRCNFWKNSRSKAGLSGYFQFIYGKNLAYRECAGPHSGLLLDAKWTISFNSFATDVVSVEMLKLEYDGSVMLCPHVSLSDWVTPEEMLRCLRFCRSENLDPLQIHRRERAFKAKEECRMCHTHFKRHMCVLNRVLTVTSIRYLGQGKSAKDPIWLSQ
ncbi:MAG: hypothetical protein Q9193_000656 [Seirophora villosa]